MQSQQVCLVEKEKCDSDMRQRRMGEVDSETHSYIGATDQTRSTDECSATEPYADTCGEERETCSPAMRGHQGDSIKDRMDK
jgi:hypothetical protein